MSTRYFRLRPSQHGSLQEKTREVLLEAIHSGTLPPEAALPSCRQLAAQLGVSRNTVAIVYEGLVEDGYLISRPCSGYYLSKAYSAGFAKGASTAPESSPEIWQAGQAMPPVNFEPMKGRYQRETLPQWNEKAGATPHMATRPEDAHLANASNRHTADHQEPASRQQSMTTTTSAGYVPTWERKRKQPDHSKLATRSSINSAARHTSVDWHQRFSHQPSLYTSVPRPSRWTTYPFPFIYGQHEGERFPLAEWRISARRLLDERQDKLWLNDSYDQDDAALLEQLRTRILPRRGIIAGKDEILITLGAQNALFLIAQLLFTPQTQVSIENPGYRDAFNIFTRQGAQLDLCAVDEHGITLSAASKHSDYLYVTPSQQVPCGMTMSAERRQALLDQATHHDQIIIEDDYDAELKIAQASLPALRSHPEGDRVIYLSSFSKTLSPSLRLGYIVAEAELIDELRALRRLMYRHPPTALQRQLAQFIAQGHFDRSLRHQQDDNSKRWALLEQARQHYLPNCERISSEYANAFWLKAPNGCDTEQLRWRAAHEGVLIEPGVYHFFTDEEFPHPKQFMRLGFGAIQESRIDEGIRRLAEALHTL